MKKNESLQIVNLGCQNGWNMRNPPSAYVKHEEHCGRYTLVRREIGNCWNEYTCEQCGIRFTVDSSG